MRRAIHTPSVMARLVVPALIGTLVSGCAGEPQSYWFSMEDETEYSVHHYWFFPVVEVDGELVLGEARRKIFDASGYGKREISAAKPRNLLNGWMTPGLKEYRRVGLVLFRGDDDMQPVMDDPRVFWFATKNINSTSDVTYVHVPAFDSLETIELQPQWGTPKDTNE